MARTRTRPFFAFLACCLACLGAPTAMGFTTAVRQSPQSPGFFRRSGVAMNANPLLKVASRGMGLIKPLFVAEAQIQSAVLGGIAGVSDSDVQAEIDTAKAKSPVLIYTYKLSPFSTEALELLDSTGFEFTEIELGLEWFTLGGRGSKTRTVLASMVENGATSLPKIFIGGEPLSGASGFSALAESVESGQLEGLLAKAGAKRIS